MPHDKKRRFIVLSNRLPIAVGRGPDGELTASQGAGGLVTALAPVLGNRGGAWIGWPGSAEKGVAALCRNFSRQAGYFLRPVSLTEAEVEGYYRGFSNEILWPLFHEFQMPCNFLPAYWGAYRTANAAFADAAAAAAADDDLVWVHDYHLMLVARLLKAKGRSPRLGFFLHIPFPPADIFLKIPWRLELVDALLDFDLIGFQTLRDRRNFFDVVKRLHPSAMRKGRGEIVTLTLAGETTRLGVFPISIDFAAFADRARDPGVRQTAKDIRQAFDNRFLLFGADRLDYTKGVPQRLDALQTALTRFPELRGKVCLILVLVPSREEVPQYRAMKEDIERMVGEINGRWSRPGWAPVHFVYRNLPHDELIAYYAASDMALVTPLRDGMNLVAKEYAACNVAETGILCLSEFAGAAMELHRHAVMVNPFDVVGVAEAIRDGAAMAPGERRRRMRAIRAIIRRHDIFQWVDAFLDAAFSTHLGDFPRQGLGDWADPEAAPEAGQGPPWDTADRVA
jgi:trehalose 6-phosphate synthase